MRRRPCRPPPAAPPRPAGRPGGRRNGWRRRCDALAPVRPARVAAFWMASAASAAWLRRVVDGSRPKTAATPVGPIPRRVRRSSRSSHRSRSRARRVDRRRGRPGRTEEGQMPALPLRPADGRRPRAGWGRRGQRRRRSRAARPQPVPVHAERSVFREIPRAAAVRRMFPPFSRERRLDASVAECRPATAPGGRRLRQEPSPAESRAMPP